MNMFDEQMGNIKKKKEIHQIIVVNTFSLPLFNIKHITHYYCYRPTENRQLPVNLVKIEIQHDSFCILYFSPKFSYT